MTKDQMMKNARAALADGRTAAEVAIDGAAEKVMNGGGVGACLDQYRRFKATHPDCVLLFGIGEFYEMFYDDAERVSKSLGLTLTSRGGVPMAGIPAGQLDQYLRKLVAAGFRVALCEKKAA